MGKELFKDFEHNFLKIFLSQTLYRLEKYYWKYLIKTSLMKILDVQLAHLQKIDPNINVSLRT